MNGNEFISELTRQIKAVQALGACCGSWATTYKMYDECEHKLGKFIVNNRLNIVLCLDAMDYNTMYISTDDIFNTIQELYSCGDYDGAIDLLCKHNTSWKYRKALERLIIAPKF
jgi:hypothetical protein